MAKNISQTEKDLIKEEYLKGLSYKDISKRYGYSSSTISSIVKSLRSHKESCILSHRNGNYQLTDDGRKRLSENGKKCCQKSGKMWTKPEREFRNILNEIGIGVKFSDDIKDMFNLKDDDNPIIYFQYPIQRYICDFAEPISKIVFRVMGDFWHGNPLLYNKNNLSKIQKYNISRDKNKKIYLNKNGWDVIDIWESDIYWRKDIVKQAIGAVGSISGLHPEGHQFKSDIAYSSKEWTEKLNDIWFKKSQGRPKKIKKIKLCLYCKKEFEVKRETIYCSHECHNMSRRFIERPSKEQLLKEIELTSYCAVGRKYGVSDNCIRKWLR